MQIISWILIPGSFPPLLLHSGWSRTNSAIRSSNPRIFFCEVESLLICRFWTPRILPPPPPPPWPWYDFAMIDPISNFWWEMAWYQGRSQETASLTFHETKYPLLLAFQTRSLSLCVIPTQFNGIDQNWPWSIADLLRFKATRTRTQCNKSEIESRRSSEIDAAFGVF